MASCHDFLEALYAYAAGEVPQPKRKALAGHLAGCLSCRAELKRYEQVIQLAQQLPGVTPPPHLLSRFRDAVKGTKPPPKKG